MYLKGAQETRVLAETVGDSLVTLRVLPRNQRLGWEQIQWLLDAHGAQGRAPAAAERQRVWRSPTLRVDVDASHGSWQNVYEGGGGVRATREHRCLLPIPRFFDVIVNLNESPKIG